MFSGPRPSDIDNWVCIKQSNIDFEIEMAKNYLSNLQIPSNILSKRDSAYSLTVGEMALIYLYVPKEYEEEARQALDEWEKTDPMDDDEEE